MRNIDINILAGNNKVLLGDYKGAILEFTKSIIMNPNYPHAYSSRATAKFELRDYEGTISDCREALKLHFKSDWDLNLELKGNSKKELKINPIYGRLYYIIGMSKILLDKPEEGFLHLNCARLLGYNDASDMIRIYTR